MCLIIWSSCASGDMSKCDKCGKLCTGSHVGQVWMVVQDLETWVCNNCAIPPPNYPPPALVQRPDDKKYEDMANKKARPPPRYPPPAMCDKNHGQKNDDEENDQSDDDMDVNNDDTKDDDLVNLIWHDVDAYIIAVLILYVL